MIQKHQQSPQILISNAFCQFVVLLLSTFCGFSTLAAGFVFAFGNFAYYCVILLNAPLSNRDKKKPFCNGLLFLGNLDSLSLTPEGLVVPLVCSFRRQDNLLAWHELFANLYELKSHIWFWKEYNYLEQIYRVYGCRCSTHHVLNFLNKNVSPPAVCPDRRYTHHSGRSGLWRYWNKNGHITSQIDTRAKLQMARKENKFHQNIPRIMKNVQVWQKILDIWSICPMLSIYVTHLAYFQLLRL